MLKRQLISKFHSILFFTYTIQMLMHFLSQLFCNLSGDNLKKIPKHPSMAASRTQSENHNQFKLTPTVRVPKFLTVASKYHFNVLGKYQQYRNMIME